MPHVKALFGFEDDQIAALVSDAFASDPSLAVELLESGYFLKILNLSLPSNVKAHLVEDLVANKGFRDAVVANDGLVRAWEGLRKSPDSRISALATDVSQLKKYTEIVESNNLGLDEVSLGNLMMAKTATKNLPWEYPDRILDAVQRASNANIDVVTIKGFPTPSEGNTSFVLNNAKQYQLEASGDALLSFEKGGRSFDNATPDGALIDRKYGYGSSIFNPDGTIHNQSRAQSVLDQAQAQIDAAGGMLIRWEVSTELGADGIQALFDINGIDIQVIHVVQQTIIN